MVSNYESIRLVNEKKYGTEVGRVCEMLMVNRYDDRTHFIYELLQNADDALARRSEWNGSRAVSFRLCPDALYVSHFGQSFDVHDVEGICGLGESTKEQTAIGRFGIGFKSVFAFTDRPEIHSGDEDFAIETFVWPFGTSPLVGRDRDETIFILPLSIETETAVAEITRGFRQLGPKTLLFLRQIEEIAWQVDGGPSGLYLRSRPEIFDDGVRRVTVIGQEDGKSDVEESWLVFSRQVMDATSSPMGYIEIAFSLDVGEDDTFWSIKPIRNSPLVVYFPTILETNLGVLMQGPYITTPSRDNVLRSHPWNQHLVRETATLLIEALRWLRDYELLDVTSLYCLPLDGAKLSEDNMFAPLYDILPDALKSEALLPRFGGGYACANQSRLARTQELRELFSPQQLAAIFDNQEELFWLSPEITQDRTPELRRYLLNELGIAEVTPETILPRLDEEFLEAQPDEWITRLYEFLSIQRGLRAEFERLPLIRLENGTHIPAYHNGTPQVFLPSSHQTGFATVRRGVCASEKARAFLQLIGIKEPDPVDNVIQNVLPKYSTDEIDIDETTYEKDFSQILAAFKTDSTAQRDRLIGELRVSSFVKAVDSGKGLTCRRRPDDLYLPTDLLLGLFAEVDGILFVDHSVSCLKRKDTIELLETCGASRYLRRLPFRQSISSEQRAQLRRAAGCIDCTYEFPPSDYSLHGLSEVLKCLPIFDSETKVRKAGLLWQALSDLEEEHGKGAFSGVYMWQYYSYRSTYFDASFIQQLNEIAWIPDGSGNLDKPEFVPFDTLGWEPNALLQSKIHFRSSEIDTLAREAGFDPGCLDFLKKNGITTQEQAEQLVALLQRATRDEGSVIVPSIEEDEDALEKHGPGGTRPQPLLDSLEEQHTERSVEHQGRSSSKGLSSRSRETQPAATGSVRDQSRRFISYVGVYPYEETDPDGLETQQRLEVEEQAIQLVLAREPELCRTPVNNPGYDLFESGVDGQTTRWIEVKAMSGSLYDRPVGMSSVQFECARLHGEAFWLYVVEHVLDNDKARVVRIQNPAARAQTFTFDHGWLDVALFDMPNAS